MNKNERSFFVAWTRSDKSKNSATSSSDSKLLKIDAAMIKSGVLKGVLENKNGLRNRIAKMETTSKAMTGETADLEWCGNISGCLKVHGQPPDVPKWCNSWGVCFFLNKFSGLVNYDDFLMEQLVGHAFQGWDFSRIYKPLFEIVRHC